MATTFTFEHIGRPKTADAQICRRDPALGRQRPYPNDNYLSGDGKSNVWMGFRHYSPTDRSWQKHHEKIALPNERVAGQITFDSEDQWRDWQFRRDRPNSKYCASTGFRNANPPCELQQSGYAFNPNNLFRTGLPALTVYNPHNPWPKTDIRTFPTWRGPRGYYGYYHEELDVHHDGGYRFPRDPRVLVNDEDVLKYEYMRNTPSCHTKLPVEFPVLM